MSTATPIDNPGASHHLYKLEPKASMDVEPIVAANCNESAVNADSGNDTNDNGTNDDVETDVVGTVVTAQVSMDLEPVVDPNISDENSSAMASSGNKSTKTNTDDDSKNKNVVSFPPRSPLSLLPVPPPCSKSEEKAFKNGYCSERGCTAINGMLRESTSVKEKDVKRFGKYVPIIKSVLAKLPPFHGTVYRGCDKKYMDLTHGATFTDKAFTSASRCPDIAKSFMKKVKSAGGEPIMLEISHSSGKSIEHLSCISSEQEVLFAPDVVFAIDRVEGHYVWIHEIVESIDRRTDDDGDKDKCTNNESDISVTDSTSDITIVVKVPDTSTAIVPFMDVFKAVTVARLLRVDSAIEVDQHDCGHGGVLPDGDDDSGVVDDEVGGDDDDVVDDDGDSSSVASASPMHDTLGSIWMDGRRRSARHYQPPISETLGSVMVNGLRRSSRLL